MPITTLDPISALVVVDLQHGLAHMDTETPIGEIAEQNGLLTAAFRDRGLPVVLVTADGNAPGRTDTGRTEQIYPAGFAAPLPELEPQAGNHTVVKQRWGAFHGTGLDDHLRRRGVTQVVITGVATSIGVESTAPAAYDAGFHATIATDAVTDADPDAHHHSLTRIFPPRRDRHQRRDSRCTHRTTPKHPAKADANRRSSSSAASNPAGGGWTEPELADVGDRRQRQDPAAPTWTEHLQR